MSEIKKITFPGSQGAELAATLDLPSDQPLGFALLAHCFSCSKDLLAERVISQALAERGIAVLRFDFTGLGASEGDFSDTNFSSNVGDLVAAADFLKEHYQAPDILIGHSLGGSAVLAAAAQISTATAVVTIAAPSDPANIEHLFMDDVPEIEAKGEKLVQLGGRPFLIKKQLLDDIEKQNLLNIVSHFKKALLVFHSPHDELVSIEHARKIYDAAKHPKSFISLDHANHLLTNKKDAQYVADVIAAWVSRYII